MSKHHARLTQLRNELARLGLDGFILASGDEHITEFPTDYAKRLAGFTGSTASVAVLARSAAAFVDGRYTGAVRVQIEAADWSYEDVPKTDVGAWLTHLAAPLGRA